MVNMGYHTKISYVLHLFLSSILKLTANIRLFNLQKGAINTILLPSLINGIILKMLVFQELIKS
ncbi:MAG: hypothetical protein ACI8P3_003615, partial [Saprospiraceae bacterium]